MATLFNLAFSDIEKNEQLNKFNIAIVDNTEYQNDEVLKTTFQKLEKDIFDIEYTNIEKAKELLEEKEIVGYLEKKENNINININKNGIEETIFKYVVDEIMIINSVSKDLINDEIASNNQINYEEIYQRVLNKINEEIKLNDTSPSNLSYTMIEYYTLIAMTCLYGGIIGMTSTNNMLANMSKKGSRVAVSPIKKSKLLLSSTIASYIVEIIGVALLFLYTIFVIGVDYGDKIFPVILIALIGSLAGLTFGIAIATLIKKNETTKVGIIISITMICSFLSGMMGITMKYIVDKNFRILNLINPTSMITDGLYSLYYYPTMERYWFNIISLLIFSTVMILVSLVELRRQKYDSI
ncbi:MAG: ABC transporter permease [Bacilli bacterium]|nr:ABC transporter permease [Bacilli bacterium]